MSTHHLDTLLRPRSVAVFGASDLPGRIGTLVLRNILGGGFPGPVYPVNPKYQRLGGLAVYADTDALPETPELAVVCAPPVAVPGIVAQLGARGTKAAVVLTAGLGLQRGADGRTLEQAVLASARSSGLRILGPNCVGLLSPHARLNASFAHIDAAPGDLAFVSQSGALCTAVLDWARQAGIGFSCFLSLGDSREIDLADTLDLLGSDAGTRAILLYIESVGNARKFLSAARAAARNKPLVAIKSGRVSDGKRAAASHTGALAGSDDACDYALRRAGILRVDEIAELFDAAETLERVGPLRGERLAILTNGGGPGVMAVDTLVRGGGRLAQLAPQTLARLDAILPPTWSRGNPIDLIGDALPERYRQALAALAGDPGIDALLVLACPVAIAPAEEYARVLVETAAGLPVPVLSCWLGPRSSARARQLLSEAGIAGYETPGEAVAAFLHRVQHERAQELLRQTPAAAPDDVAPGAEAVALVRGLLHAALAEGRQWLDEHETKRVLAAYGLPTVATEVVSDASQAAAVAARIGFPVALKLLSPDVLHKSDVGGVVLDLESEEAVRAAAEAMLVRLQRHRPEARVKGFTVQAMARRPGAYEVFLGAALDEVFGPVLLFGQGGIAIEALDDKALALPPLNMLLARELIGRTRIARLLSGFRSRPPVDLDALALALLRVGQLVGDHAEIVELDVNPVLVDDHGLLALDARMRIAPAAVRGPERLAIRPYPNELEETARLPSGRELLLRPIRPEDEPAHRALFARYTDEDIRFRFFHLVKQLPHSEMARYTQIDYDREMAFVALDPAAPGTPEQGVVRAVVDSENASAEFAIIVPSDVAGQGIGRLLLEKLIRYQRARGTRTLIGRVLPQNTRMLALAAALGFTRRSAEGGDEIVVELALQG